MVDIVMKEINGYYLYSLGAEIHPLANIHSGDSFGEWEFACIKAQIALEGFFNRSLFPGHISREEGGELYTLLKQLYEEQPQRLTEELAAKIRDALLKFEHFLDAEFKTMSIFLIEPVRGYDTRSLIYNGRVLFPLELESRVPKALLDADAAARCIAFDLPTSAGYHLMRATEAVLREYWDIVTDGAEPPNNRNMGDYLRQMDEKEVGDPKVKAALKDIKDLYRNPLLHPEDNLESVEDAIALLGSVQAAIAKMLVVLPDKKPHTPAETS